MENIGITAKQLDSEAALLRQAVSRGPVIGHAQTPKARPATLDKLNAQAADLQGQCHQLKVQLDSLLAELRGDDRSSGQVEASPDYPPSRLDQIEMKQTDAQNVVALCSTLVGDIREMLFDQNRIA